MEAAYRGPRTDKVQEILVERLERIWLSIWDRFATARKLQWALLALALWLLIALGLGGLLDDQSVAQGYEKAMNCAL